MGWNVPDEKSPLPDTVLRAVGVMVDLSPLPAAEALIEVLKDRANLLIDEIEAIELNGNLKSGRAGALVGALGFLNWATEEI